MAAVYLACEINLDELGSVGAFGYVGIDAGDYVPPVGDAYLRTVINVAAVAAMPSGEWAPIQENFTGGYEIDGYGQILCSLVSGEYVGPYQSSTYVTLKFYVPDGLSGLVTFFVKAECSGAIGVDEVGGGGAGYGQVIDLGGSLALDMAALWSADTTGDITFTTHLVGSGDPPEPPAAFWTNFIGSREIL